MASAKKHAKSGKKSVKPPAQRTESANSPRASTIYKDFVVYRSKTKPKWHPIKMMRYVFFRMIGGCTVTDAITEIHWSASEFWHLVDLKRHGPFRLEYKRAKTLQGRAFSDSVVTIAEGRDRVTRISRKRMEKLLKRAIGRASKTKNSFKAKMIVQQLMSDLRETEKDIIQRNKLQIDSAKWIAKTSNPNEFSEKSTVAVGAPAPNSDQTLKPFVVQFVGPNGEVVPP